MRLIRVVVLIGVLLGLSIVVQAENLAKDAAYSAFSSGYIYPGQILPGTNSTPAKEGWVDAPQWQGADILADGKQDTGSVESWFWSQMNKRITTRFDLRRTAKITQIRVWPVIATHYMMDTMTAKIASSVDGLAAAQSVNLVATDGVFTWQGTSVEGRYVEILCYSGSPIMGVSEVEIDGDPLGNIATDAHERGLIPVAPRDLAVLTKLPEKPHEAVNAATSAGVMYTLTSQHTDDRNANVDDNIAASSDPGGRTLVDGNPASSVSTFAGYYASKVVTAEFDLGKQWNVDRIIVWSAGHVTGTRSYLNSYEVWIKAGPDAAWEPLGQTWNPVLPGEIPGAEYPVFTGEIKKLARYVRVQMNSAMQSGEVMKIGEINIWGIPASGNETVKSVRIIKHVPEVKPVKIGKISHAFDWIFKDRIRAMFCYPEQWKDKALIDNLVKTGFNTVVFHTMYTWHSAEGFPAEMKAWALVQKERKLHVFVSMPYGSDERYGNTQFGGYQPGGGTRWTRTPCPLSREYWDRVVGDRAEIAAKVGLTGLVVDMEMYGGDATRFTGPCYCETCWSRFVKEHIDGLSPADVDISNRASWIAGNGLALEYARWQEIEVMGILKGIEKRVHAIKPNFIFGNLLDPESVAGLSRGFGTPTMPSLIFSELEYQGNISGVQGRLTQLKTLGYPSLYVPGFWIQPVKPQQLPDLVKESAIQSAGYWIWSSAAFGDGVKGDFAHNKDYTHDDYWKAFKVSNQVLTKQLASKNIKKKAITKVPQVIVPRVKSAPVSDVDWAKAVKIGPFVHHVTGEIAKADTYTRMLWDGKCLYLKIMCSEPTPEKSPVSKGGRDESTIWLQDSIEIFWTRPDSDRTVQLMINSAGTVYDALSIGLRDFDPGWNADIISKAKQIKGGWELYVTIPVDADGGGIIKPNGKLRFEIARNRPGGQETTSWTRVGGMFKGAPDLWGVLVLK